MNEIRSVYDLGNAGIAVVEAALVKEQAEHQAFRAEVAAALTELLAQAEAGQAKWFGRHNEANICQDFAESVSAAMDKLGLAAEGQ